MFCFLPKEIDLEIGLLLEFCCWIFIVVFFVFFCNVLFCYCFVFFAVFGVCVLCVCVCVCVCVCICVCVRVCVKVNDIHNPIYFCQC